MRDRMRDSTDAGTERLSDDPDRPSTKPAVGGAVGGVSGAAVGAAAGTLTAGPVGTIVGAIIGAVGGGWAGVAASNSAAPSEEDEAYYRSHYGTATRDVADASYERARPAYHLGYYAGLNTDYDGRTFEEVERDLRHGWTDDVRARYGDWESARPYARAAYERSLTRRNANPGSVRPSLNLGGTESHHRAEFNDRLAPEAPVAGNPNADAPPSDPDIGAPGWMRHPSDQGGFGVHMKDDDRV
ncbi:MAG TPA: hypothetical protein VFX39_02680 [Gemmatimonadaceae bacterium]|nr:hypothetical protein [Gemmatimonadaceae bacterium]